jgi:hypothetical protein
VKRVSIGAAFALATGLSATVLAQWPAYPVANVPKTADGKPDLNAPAPRLPDGKPDLSGVWETAPCAGCGVPVIDGLGGPPAQGRGAGAPPADGRGAAAPATTQGAGGGTPPAAQGGAGAAPSGQSGGAAGPGGGRGRGGPIRSVFANIGASLPDGVAPYQPWAADLVKERVANNSKDNPDAHCLPMGIMQLTSHPYPKKLIQTPTEVLLIYEGSGTTVREVFLDGRPLPNKDQVEPWWNGYSVGHWDGDTLVVETTGFMDDGWLDVRGSPLTSSGKITERYRRLNFGYLEIEVTIDDPKAYTKPFAAKVYNRIMLNSQLSEFVCIDKDARHYVGGSGK